MQTSLIVFAPKSQKQGEIFMLLKHLLVLLVQFAVSVSAYGALSIDGQIFPDSVAGIVWQGSTNFGEVGGVAVSYKGKAIKTDIYYFMAGDPLLKDKPLAERYVAECINVVLVMDEMVKRGYYSDLKKGEVKDVVSNGITFTRIEFQYVEKGLARHAYVHLAQHKEKLLKVRVTIEDSTNQDLVNVALSDASLSFKK